MGARHLRRRTRARHLLAPRRRFDLLRGAGQGAAPQPGLALSRDDRRIVHDRTIDTHVKNLRRKLEEAGLAEAISAVYGVGYRWEARSARQP